MIGKEMSAISVKLLGEDKGVCYSSLAIRWYRPILGECGGSGQIANCISLSGEALDVHYVVTWGINRTNQFR